MGLYFADTSTLPSGRLTRPRGGCLERALIGENQPHPHQEPPTAGWTVSSDEIAPGTDFPHVGGSCAACRTHRHGEIRPKSDLARENGPSRCRWHLVWVTDSRRLPRGDWPERSSRGRLQAAGRPASRCQAEETAKAAKRWPGPLYSRVGKVPASVESITTSLKPHDKPH